MGNIWEISVPVSQFYCEPKTVLKKKKVLFCFVLFVNRKKSSGKEKKEEEFRKGQMGTVF